MRYGLEPLVWDAPSPIDEGLNADATTSAAASSAVIKAQAAWDLHHSAGLAPSTYTFGKQVT
jgi:hypothetical protein